MQIYYWHTLMFKFKTCLVVVPCKTLLSNDRRHTHNTLIQQQTSRHYEVVRKQSEDGLDYDGYDMQQLQHQFQKKRKKKKMLMICRLTPAIHCKAMALALPYNKFKEIGVCMADLHYELTTLLISEYKIMYFIKLAGG